MTVLCKKSYRHCARFVSGVFRNSLMASAGKGPKSCKLVCIRELMQNGGFRDYICIN